MIRIFTMPHCKPRTLLSNLKFRTRSPTTRPRCLRHKNLHANRLGRSYRKMTKPILYGTYLSPPVRSVLLVAKEIGIELEFREVNLFGAEHMKSDYTEKNPQHTVPTLDDEGFIVWDSHAIATYLIGKYAKDDYLYSKDLRKRALIDQRLHFDSGIIFPHMRAIFERVIFFNEVKVSEEKVKALDQAYSFMEKFLEKTPYLVGESMTVADLCCIASISSTQGILAVDGEKYPKLAAWMKRMEALPYYADTNGNYAKALADFVNNKIVELSE